MGIDSKGDRPPGEGSPSRAADGDVRVSLSEVSWKELMCSLMQRELPRTLTLQFGAIRGIY